MFDCPYKGKCEEYLRGERELRIDPPITKKPVCDGLSCSIFLALEHESYKEFLQSPLFHEIDEYLTQQDQQSSIVVNKVLQKTILEKQRKM